MATPLTTRDLGRPIRVIVFGGAFLERAALELLARLDEHPEIELVGGVCQSRGFAFHHSVGDVIRRRRMMAVPVLGVYAAQAALRVARHPRAEWVLRKRVRRPLLRITAVPNIHAPTVLAQVHALSPDLGLSYGSPVLRPSLFGIPAFGTLGIHHGKLPEYRGKKTAFWAMLNGEATAGVTIQRINAGLDRGEIVREGEVPIAGKRYGRVEAEIQELGLTLCMAAILAVKRGEARCWPQRHVDAPLYRQPSARDILRLWRRQLMLGPRAG